MSPRLSVHLNREQVHSIAPETTTFETPGSFEIELVNHGQPAHVHIRLEGDLARIGTLSAGNHYVEEDSVRRVRIAVETEHRPLSGKLTVVTGYGKETEYVDVTVVEPPESAGPIKVDESLSQPRARDPESGVLELARNIDGAAVLMLAGVALALSVGALAVARGPAVVIGAVAVLAGVLVAACLLVR